MRFGVESFQTFFGIDANLYAAGTLNFWMKMKNFEAALNH